MSGVSIATGGIITTTISGSGGDWSEAEKEQIRSALGITGTKKAIKDSELSPMKLFPFTI